MTAQLQALLDKKVEGLVVVGVTSCPEEMDLALRRPCRQEVEGGDVGCAVGQVGDG